MKLNKITLHQIKLPLISPYEVSARTHIEFEPVIVELKTEGEITGVGEIFVPTQSDKVWEICSTFARALVGDSTAAAKEFLEQSRSSLPIPVTGWRCAIDLLENHPIFMIQEEARVPLLSPISKKLPSDIEEEVEQLLLEGYETLKVKVGFNVDDDLRKLKAVQTAVKGRAGITVDANCGYSMAEGRKFVRSLNPEGILLFEQPCDMDDWAANASVAEICPVPFMLDESIKNFEDIERAARIPGVKLVKLKMKRTGGVDHVVSAIKRARSLGLDLCFGDGVAVELTCWMEACISRMHISRAGEMNGFLKPRNRILKDPVRFDKGSIILSRAYRPELDLEGIRPHLVRSTDFS